MTYDFEDRKSLYGSKDLVHSYASGTNHRANVKSVLVRNTPSANQNLETSKSIDYHYGRVKSHHEPVKVSNHQVSSLF